MGTTLALLFLHSFLVASSFAQFPEVALMPHPGRKGMGIEQMSRENFTAIDYSLYHHSYKLLKDVKSLVARHPGIMKAQTWTSEVNGYKSEILVVTNENKDSNVPYRKKLRALISCGQHARELITSEVCLRLLTKLSGENGLLDAEFQQVLHQLVIKVVPIENANGRSIVEDGKYCERKNGRGVDINRNWNIDWGKKEKDFDPSEEFPGVAPFSEPETRVMKEIAVSFKPHLWINVHSGMEALFMPYDYKIEKPTSRSTVIMKQLLNTLNKLYCNGKCVVGSGGAAVGYLAHGTATDYIYDVLKIPLAFTFEIYGDSDAPNNDCFRMFNPRDSSLFETTVSKWSKVLLASLEQLGEFRALSSDYYAMSTAEEMVLSSLDNLNEVVLSETSFSYATHLGSGLHRHRERGFHDSVTSWAGQQSVELDLTIMVLLSSLFLILLISYKFIPLFLRRFRTRLPSNNVNARSL